MENKTAFKFSPIYSVFLIFLTIYVGYQFSSLVHAPLISAANFLPYLVLFCLAYFILPIILRFIFNSPAIILTDDYLINNFGGHSLEWGDITYVELMKGGSRNFANIAIDLKDPYKYFNTPISKTLYKTKQLFLAHDIFIKVDFIAGNNENILRMIEAYWTRHDENKIK